MELKEGLLGFDTAIQLLKDGCKVTRERWVGSCDLYFRTNRSRKVNIGIK
jgi:hypothetical protein